ncbi:hypothetical protein Acsp03_72070 [Actinomadura sp. NBRC 104412]|nr:hypothetical protein Acsp03_72070 [Actinomadura sp. NBRC 104412]
MGMPKKAIGREGYHNAQLADLISDHEKETKRERRVYYDERLHQSTG